MNTEKNKKIWLNKCEDTLRIGGRSEVTIRNYTYGIKHFLNNYGNQTKISNFNEDKIIDYIPSLSLIN